MKMESYILFQGDEASSTVLMLTAVNEERNRKQVHLCHVSPVVQLFQTKFKIAQTYLYFYI